MNERRDESSSDGSMNYFLLFWYLWHHLFRMLRVVLLQDVRFLDKLQICWIVFHQSQLQYSKIQQHMDKGVLNVCVTGAAGQIAYSFIPQLCSGRCFPDVTINLSLLDVEPALNALKGVVLELQDCSYPLVNSITFGCKAAEQFKDADVIVFLGGFPRKPGMQRKDLLQINKNIFKEQAQSLSAAKPTVRCVVIANPANTNAYILSYYAPQIPKENITCLSRLDHNRALGQIVEKTNCKLEDIQGVYIFGNHSLTQYPCINNITVKGKPISEFADREWLENTYIPKVQKRGGQILSVRGGSSVFSAANAVIDHLRDWYQGTSRVISLGVPSEGNYGVPTGLWSSFPVRCPGGFKYEIVKDIVLSEFCNQKISQSVKQIQEEIEAAQV